MLQFMTLIIKVNRTSRPLDCCGSTLDQAQAFSALSSQWPIHGVKVRYGEIVGQSFKIKD